jgi:hypothetical protein
MDRGLISEADSYARRTLPQSIIDDLPNLTNHRLLAYLARQADTLMNGLALLDIDYVNFHWYEPVIERNNKGISISDTTQIDTKAMEESIAYLHRKTGKTIITNKSGELHISPGIVTNMMQKFYDLKMPYIIWYSGDGSGGAVSLNNLNGSVPPNGQAFVNFTTQHY